MSACCLGRELCFFPRVLCGLYLLISRAGPAVSVECSSVPKCGLRMRWREMSSFVGAHAQCLMALMVAPLCFVKCKVL